MGKSWRWVKHPESQPAAPHPRRKLKRAAVLSACLLGAPGPPARPARPHGRRHYLPRQRRARVLRPPPCAVRGTGDRPRRGGGRWVSLILSPGSAIAPQRHITGSVRHSLNPAASPGAAGGQILHLLPHQGPCLPRGLSHRTSVTQADAHKGEMEEAPPASASGVTSPGTCRRDRWGGS